MPACQLSVDDEGAPNTDQCTDHPNKAKNIPMSTRTVGETVEQFDDGEGE